MCNARFVIEAKANAKLWGCHRRMGSVNFFFFFFFGGGAYSF